MGLHTRSSLTNTCSTLTVNWTNEQTNNKQKQTTKKATYSCRLFQKHRALLDTFLCSRGFVVQLCDRVHFVVGAGHGGGASRNGGRADGLHWPLARAAQLLETFFALLAHGLDIFHALEDLLNGALLDNDTMLKIICTKRLTCFSINFQHSVVLSNTG